MNLSVILLNLIVKCINLVKFHTFQVLQFISFGFQTMIYVHDNVGAYFG
jgi:hypothetical protein